MQDSNILWKSETEIILQGSLFHIKMWNILEDNKNCSTGSETNESPFFREWESLVSLFWTTGDVFPGFQKPGWIPYLYASLFACCGSSYSTVVIDLLTSWWSTLQPSLFLSTYFFKHWWDSGSSVQHSVHSNHLSHSRSTSHIKYLVFITFTKRGNKVSTIHCNQSGPTGSEKKENYLKRNCNQYRYSEWRCTKRLNFGWSVTPFYRTLKLVAKYKQSGHLHKEGLHSGSDNLRRY